MTNYTPNINLKKPLETDIVDINDFNSNYDKIDQAIGEINSGNSKIEGLETVSKTISGAINEIKKKQDSVISQMDDKVNLVTLDEHKLQVSNEINKKVDKVEGKVLSTNDYTSAEKDKLAGIATGANNYTHPSTHPPSIILQDASNRFITDIERTKLSRIEDNANNYVHPSTHSPSIIAQDASNRFITDIERTKLSSIADNANNYVHPSTHAASMITESTSRRFVSDTEKATWNSKATINHTHPTFNNQKILLGVGHALSTQPYMVSLADNTTWSGYQHITTLGGMTYLTPRYPDDPSFSSGGYGSNPKKVTDCCSQPFVPTYIHNVTFKSECYDTENGGTNALYFEARFRFYSMSGTLLKTVTKYFYLNPYYNNTESARTMFLNIGDGVIDQPVRIDVSVDIKGNSTANRYPVRIFGLVMTEATITTY